MDNAKPMYTYKRNNSPTIRALSTCAYSVVWGFNNFMILDKKKYTSNLLFHGYCEQCESYTPENKMPTQSNLLWTLDSL